MASFLEELYFGNIDPQARGYRKDSHIIKVSDSINELEEKLTERLQDEDKSLFLDFCNAYGELMVMPVLIPLSSASVLALK